VAYQLSVGGSDWRSIVVRDVASGDVIETPLEDVKFSGISWLNNEGFFYSSYDKPDGSELSAKTDQHKLYFHQNRYSSKSRRSWSLAAWRSKNTDMSVQTWVETTATCSSAPRTPPQETSFL
jgi:prolyl oligopeptidase PreP (S9A serine peptidase family)